MKSNYLFIEKDYFWEIPIAGRKVSRIVVDYALKIQFFFPDPVGGEETEITIEGPCHFEMDGRKYELNVGENPTGLGPIFAIRGEIVNSALAFKEGRLEIDFVNRAKLIVMPLPKFEAWGVVGVRGLRVVCMPGGELAIWQADPPDTDDTFH